MAKHKVVYQDGDYTKVVRGRITEDDAFVFIENLDGKITKIGKRFIISITEND